jgi:cysteine desulfurase
VASLLGCDPEQIVFTSGGTESNNQAIRGIAVTSRDKGNHIITSRVEHPAVLEVCLDLEREGFEVSYLPVDEFGLVSVSELEETITDRTILITIMHARARGIIMHTDAAQSAGKIPTEVRKLGVQCEIAKRDLQKNSRQMRATRDRLHEGLRSTVEELKLNGHPELRLPNTLNVSFRGIAANELLAAVEDRVAASAGSACHAGSVEISPVLKAMHVPEQWARGVIRLSTGRMTTESEIDEAVRAFNDAVKNSAIKPS